VVSSTEAIQRAVAPTLQVEIPMASTSASTPNPSMEECFQADLDTAVGVGASSLDPKAVAATWELHRLREILPTASRVIGYSEKPITQKRSSDACLIIKILT
jgi:hypothetical protein